MERCASIAYFFSVNTAGKGGHQQCGAFVTKSFVKWNTAKEDFRHHAATDYHKACVTFGENFVSVMRGECPNIVLQLDSCLKKQTDENRKRLVPLIEIIILCGRQEIALRGTDNAGPPLPSEPVINY